MPVRDQRPRRPQGRAPDAAAMDANALAAARVRRFLETEPVIWLSTIRADGAPHLVPTWFVWDGEAIVIMSKPGAVKVRNLRADPRAMLALGDAEDDFDVGLLEARAEVQATPASGLPAGFEAKYAERFARSSSRRPSSPGPTPRSSGWSRSGPWPGMAGRLRNRRCQPHGVSPQRGTCRWPSHDGADSIGWGSHLRFASTAGARACSARASRCSVPLDGRGQSAQRSGGVPLEPFQRLRQIRSPEPQPEVVAAVAELRTRQQQHALRLDQPRSPLVDPTPGRSAAETPPSPLVDAPR